MILDKFRIEIVSCLCFIRAFTDQEDRPENYIDEESQVNGRLLINYCVSKKHLYLFNKDHLSFCYFFATFKIYYLLFYYITFEASNVKLKDFLRLWR